MSRYRRMGDMADSSHVPLFAVENEIYSSFNRFGKDISPSNPVPEQIPSHFTPLDFIKNTPAGVPRRSEITINTDRYKSLKYYGAGPY